MDKLQARTRLKLLFIFLFLIAQIYFNKPQYEDFSLFYDVQCFSILPIKPLKSYSDLSDKEILKKDLSKLGGVYGLIHVKSSKQYIGSSLNLYDRLMDHSLRA